MPNSDYREIRRWPRPGAGQDARQLRFAAAALCQDLRRELAHLNAGTILCNELKKIYECFYQERTLSLVDALTPYSPPSWSQTIGYAARGQRIVRSVCYDLVGSLHLDIIAVEISTIIQLLETLAGYVPAANRFRERESGGMAIRSKPAERPAMASTAFTFLNGRMVYDNGLVRIWRCPYCKWWREWEDGRCKVCGAQRDGSAGQAANPRVG